MQKNNPVYRCPHCTKCVAIVAECDICISIILHKTVPPKRPHTLRFLTERRCMKCKQDFVVEGYADLAEILRFLICYDTNYIAREIFSQNPEFIEKMREDKLFMAMINNAP